MKIQVDNKRIKSVSFLFSCFELMKIKMRCSSFVTCFVHRCRSNARKVIHKIASNCASVYNCFVIHLLTVERQLFFMTFLDICACFSR